jgi:hypothetical protein
MNQKSEVRSRKSDSEVWLRRIALEKTYSDFRLLTSAFKTNSRNMVPETSMDAENSFQISILKT